MKFQVLPILGLLALAGGAHGQQTPAVKAGTINGLLVEATVTTENPPTTVNLPAGAKRKNYTVSNVRLVNRDILEAMRSSSLLDGTLTGWSLNRVASANGTGNIYALKPGKQAVAVPAILLTQPANQGTATTGSEIVPATGTSKPNLSRKVYATLKVRNGDASATGTQTLKSATVKAGTANTTVVTQLDNLKLAGKSGTGTGILTGTYRTKKPLLANLTPFFPGDAVP